MAGISYKRFLRIPPALDTEPVTMTRLKYEGHYVGVRLFHIVVRNLLRRLSNLLYSHAGKTLDLDFRGLVEAARGVLLKEDSTRWVDWERYSRRQDVAMKFGGLLGRAAYSGCVSPFLPLLLLGQYTHVGKTTTFGLRKYVLL